MNRKKLLNGLILVTAAVFLSAAGGSLFLWRSAATGMEELQRLAVQVRSVSAVPQDTDDTDLPQSADFTAPQASDADIRPQFAELYAENSDFAGWLRIEGTNIDFPVMFTPQEPEYYLHRSFAKAYSYSGVPFIGDRCSADPPSDNLTIYGHHMKNHGMFADLLNYRQEDYGKEHALIEYDTLYEEGFYELIAAIPTSATADFKFYQYTNFSNEAVFTEWADQVKANRLYDTGVEFTSGDQFITLSTCGYHTTNGRFLVIACRRSEES